MTGPLPGDIAFQLVCNVFEGNYDEVKAALQAGQDANGHPSQLFPLLVAATKCDHVSIVQLLLQYGADPDQPVLSTLLRPRTGTENAVPGERALHIAARSGNVEIIRLLLKQSHADPNATDNRGCTPLIAACENDHAFVEGVRLLLDAGADPTLAENNGFNALHTASLRGHTDLVDIVHSAAPALLNSCSVDGATALAVACYENHEGVVSKLLSLGAKMRMPRDETGLLPLASAISKGSVGVVRALMYEGGLKALEGGMVVVVTKALAMAVHVRQAGILRLLLTVDGEDRRSEWANINMEGRYLLHHGAGFCSPAAVSVLLEAGADEAGLDPNGRVPRDVIGMYRKLNDKKVQMDPGREVAIRRMLQRGPAYRARSWAWPSDEEPAVGARGIIDGTAAASVLSSPPAVTLPPFTGLRIFRPKEMTSRKLFVRLVGRYSAKA